MNPVMLDLGFIQIKWYSFFILIAMLSACFIIYKEAKNKKIEIEDLENVLFYGIICGIIGARIYYVLFNLHYYLKDPLEIIKIWNGGLAIHGGIIGCFLFLVYYTKKKKWNLLVLLDIIAVSLLLAQAIGRWGNFFNGEAYGRVVSYDFLKSLHLPKIIIEGMYIDGFYREPTFLYESILSLIGFLLLIILRKSKKIRVGQLSGTYLIWYGVERWIIESFRSDSLMLGPIKIAQLISFLFLVIGIYLLLKNIKSNRYYKKERIILEN